MWCAKAANFLGWNQNLGYHRPSKGGLSFNLGDIIIPKEKKLWYRKVKTKLNK